MSKVKEMQLEIIELIIQGFWPVDIEKMTGFPMELILQVEEDFYNERDAQYNGEYCE